MRQWKKYAAIFAAAMMVLAGCGTQKSGEETTKAQSAESTSAEQTQAAEAEKETVDLQILATSDLHGKFAPWDYALNEESTSGSLAQVSTAVKELTKENYWGQ